MVRAAKIFLGIVAFLIGLCLMPVGLLQLMAEGPHGPHGEITGDPGGPARMMLLVGIGLCLMAGAAFVFNSARKRP